MNGTITGSKALKAALLFLFLLLPLGNAAASGEGAASFFNAGNAAFQSGDFSTAVENYQKARRQGSDDARLLYNLGCAFLKAGRIGPAIQHFEMARLRAPRDPDVNFNLEYARAQIVDALPDADQSLITRLGSLPLRRFTEDELWAQAGALFLAGFLVMGLAWPRRRGKRGRGAIIAGLVLIGLSFAASGYALAHQAEHGGRQAVIGAEKLDIKSGPGVENPTLFAVHEGLKCRVREVRGTWSLVEIPTGFTGWAPSESLLPIG